jgi:hypothetical protein
MIFGLGRGGSGRVSAAVEAAFESDDFIFARRRMEPREFDGSFVGFRPGITKESLPAKTAFTQQLGPQPLDFRTP